MSRLARALGMAALAIGLAGGAGAQEEPRPTGERPAQEQPAGSGEAQPVEEPPEGAAEAPPEEATSSASGPPQGVEVLRVRGRGIAAIETEVPASVTTFDAATIEALGAQDVSDLSRVTPNVTIVQPGATQATFFVRGVGLSDFSSNAAGAVTIFQDRVALNAPAIQTGQLFDVEAVEVLRGPQGTGPYRNASAGAIAVRSRRPTGNYTAQLRSTLGQYAADEGKGAHDAMIQDYEGALEFPIREDLWSRFAFRFRNAGAYITNGCGGATFVATSREDAHCGEVSTLDIAPVEIFQPTRVGDQHGWAARGTWRWSPSGSDLELFANLHGSRLDQPSAVGQVMGTGRLTGTGINALGGETGSGYVEPDQAAEWQTLCNQEVPGQRRCRDSAGNLITFDDARAILLPRFESILTDRPLDTQPYRGDYRHIGQTTRDAWGAFLTAEWELAGLDFFALTSYDTYQRTRDQDTDFTPDLIFEQFLEDEAWQTYSEVHVGGELADEPFGWEIGGYYIHEDLFVRDTIFLDPATRAGVVGSLLRDYSQTTDSFGLWGTFRWDFLDDFTLEGGVRYNWERKVFPFNLVVEQLNLADGSSTLEDTWQTPTGQIVLTWHIDERAQAYARYTRGFKAGHFNAQATRDFETPPADPELNDAWEAGLRGGWLDGRLNGAASVFYYKYTGYQVFLFSDQAGRPPTLEILNADEAENYGVELEGRIEPLRGWAPRGLDGLRLSGNFGYLHGEYLDFQTIAILKAGREELERVNDFSGKQLASSPRFTVSGTVEWPFDLGRWGVVTPRYDLSWEADKFFDPNEGRGSPRFNEAPPLPEYTTGQQAFFLHNLRLSYRVPTRNVELAFWVRNLTDEVYKTFVFDASNFQSLVINFVGEPRTVGADLVFTF